jgi:hypothetical protein
MTCKVVRLIEHDQVVILRISGHIHEAHISMIEDLIAKETDPLVFDLQEVTLVGLEVVRLLAACDVRGIELRNCPGFIREWLSKV